MIVRNFFDVAHSNDYYVADITEYEYPNALLAIGIIFFRKIEIIRYYMLEFRSLNKLSIRSFSFKSITYHKFQ